MSSFTIVLILIAVVAVYAIYAYNTLVSKKNLVEEGWSGIETQLKRRANLIPNLVETVKGYAGHERAVYERVTELRSKTMKATGVEERAATEGLLSGAIGNLMAVAENYPDLRANENFMGLQKELSQVEDQIQMARRYYNGTVRNLNTMIESFPSNAIANIFSFQKAVFFEIDAPEDREVPQVTFQN